MKNNQSWTPEMREQLAKMWNSRMTATLICLSGEFPGKTRNAIIGEVHRLRSKGIRMRMVGEAKLVVPPKKRVRRRRVNYAAKGRTEPKPPTPPVEPPPPPPAAAPGGVSLMELGAAECHFIITPHQVRPHEHRYCAADASAVVGPLGENCYCPYHFRLMRVAASHR